MESCIENQNTHFMFNNISLENRVIYEIMGKNIGQPDTIQTITRWAPKATNPPTHIHIHLEYVTHCFSTATMVTRTRLNITSSVHFLSCL